MAPGLDREPDSRRRHGVSYQRTLIPFVGLLLWACSATAQPFAYIAHHNNHGVTVIDTATNKVVDTIALPNTSYSRGSGAVSPDGRRFYVTDRNPSEETGRIAVIDTTIPTETPGWVTDSTLEWLGDLAAEADRPVLVFGHHHAWCPDGLHALLRHGFPRHHG